VKSNHPHAGSGKEACYKTGLQGPDSLCCPSPALLRQTLSLKYFERLTQDSLLN